jgi:Flp pilus assembly pilin Flp
LFLPRRYIPYQRYARDIVPIGAGDRLDRPGPPAAGQEPFRADAEETGHMLSRLPSAIRRLVRDRRGATAIEYTLFVALISVAAITMLRTVGQRIGNVLDAAANAMN